MDDRQAHKCFVQQVIGFSKQIWKRSLGPRKNNVERMLTKFLEWVEEMYIQNFSSQWSNCNEKWTAESFNWRIKKEIWPLQRYQC